MDAQSNSALSLLKGSAPTPGEGSTAVELGAPITKVTKTKKGPNAGKAKKAKAEQPGTDVIVAEPAMGGEVLGPDLISDTVKEIENLTKEQALSLAAELANQTDYNHFKMGGVLNVIMEQKWFEPHDNFNKYVEETYGFKPRKAFYLMSIYNTFCNIGVPWSDLKKVGWIKLKDMVDVVTKDNAAEWLAKAAEEGMTVLKFKAQVDAEKAKQKGIEGDADPQPSVKKTFLLHADQQETVAAALEKAKKNSGTDNDTVALEYALMDYLANTEKPKAAEVDSNALSAGLDATPNTNGEALTAEAVKAFMKNLGPKKTLILFEEVFPEVELEASGDFGDDEEEPAF
jgi:hypothetical protein